MYILAEILLAVAILLGIRLMGSPETAVRGNRLAAVSLLAAILLVLWPSTLLSWPIVLAALGIGGILGLGLASRVTMLQMPQMVALLNGLGGAASMLTVFAAMAGKDGTIGLVSHVTGGLGVAVGGVTLSGSLVAAAKLHRILPQKPIRPRGNRIWTSALLFLLVLLVLLGTRFTGPETTLWLLIVAVCALAFGTLFALPVGGADMPITISLLNSMSGVAASICGFVVEDALLVAAGAMVGAAGLILTRVMCSAMNRSLTQVLMGATAASTSDSTPVTPSPLESRPEKGNPEPDEPGDRVTIDPVESLLEARSIIIIPGYGMALGEAETKVRDLYDLLERRGADVKFAIHPVAGRMPGHMTVLLADVDIPYDRLVQLDEINPEFAKTDVVLIVGACDVVNPAAITAKGTPIYGMPILHAHEARKVIVCNADTKPGYSGIENPLYSRDNVVLLLGNAASTLGDLVNKLTSRASAQDEAAH